MNTLLHMVIGLVTCCYRWLRVVTYCYIFRGENICQFTFQVPILYSFPRHEYLVTYAHWACYVLLRVVTCCYIFRGEIVCQSWFPGSHLHMFVSNVTNTLLPMRFIGLVTCCLRVVTRCYLLLHL